jgi:putative ABC transport system permease protein
MPSETAYTTFQIRLDSIDVAPAFAEKFKDLAKETYAIKPPRTSNFNFSSNVFKLDASTQEWEGIRLEVTTVNEMLSGANMIVDGILIFSLIVFLVLLLITVIGILNTFRVILMERTVEIGTMRALGMQKPNVRSLILWEALFLSLLGFLGGFVMSIVVQFGLSLIPFGTTNPLSILLQNGHLNFRIELGSTLIILGMVVVATLLAALFPAIKAAKLEPAHALRTAN